MKKILKKKNILPVIRGINIYNLYKKIKFKKIINYIKYINNIKILLKYNEDINNIFFLNLIKICFKNNINLTLNFKFYNFKKINILYYINYINNIYNYIKNILKIKVFININYQCSNIYKWYSFYKKFFYNLNKLNKLDKIIFINYPNILGFPNNIILFKIFNLFKIFYKNKIFLLISLYIKKFKFSNKTLQFINCILNKNISILLSEINNISNIGYMLCFFQRRKISWWVTPKKYYLYKNNLINKKKIYKIDSIIFCKNGIRQTSIKYL